MRRERGQPGPVDVVYHMRLGTDFSGDFGGVVPEWPEA